MTIAAVGTPPTPTPHPPLSDAGREKLWDKGALADNARVYTLQRLLGEAAGDRDRWYDRATRAEAERDALRAEVKRLREVERRASNLIYTALGNGLCRNVSGPALDALNAALATPSEPQAEDAR